MPKQGASPETKEISMKRETFVIVEAGRVVCSDGCTLILSDPDRAAEALSLLRDGVDADVVAEECGGEWVF
jgi:hypothetical protein